MAMLKSIFYGLVRPGRAIDGAGKALKWLWLPLAVLLVASVLLKTSVGTPLQLEAQQAAVDAELQAQIATWPEEEQKAYEEQMAEVEKSGDLAAYDGTAAGIATTAALVFGALGALVSIVYIATFFFVAAKTWANPVKYSTMLGLAGLSLLPHAIRNTIQAVYMAGTGVWLAHPGLGALVAPGVSESAGIGYALLSQVDIFVLWGLAILLGALTSQTVGITRKRATIVTVVFICATGILQAVPVLAMSAVGGVM